MIVIGPFSAGAQLETGSFSYFGTCLYLVVCVEKLHIESMDPESSFEGTSHAPVLKRTSTPILLTVWWITVTPWVDDIFTFF